MADFPKRHFSKVVGRMYTTILDKEHNNFRKLSHASNDTKKAFIKCPVNIGDCLKKPSDRKGWKDFKLYVKYLDMKVQNPDCGTFHITRSEVPKKSHRFYQRLINQLIERGWASRKGKTVYLRAYQFVWRDMGINRVSAGKKKIEKFKYWKIPVSMFSENRQDYLKEIENEIRKRISQRKQAQIRYALKDKDNTRATFSARSAGSLFGYKSTSTGTKLRSKYFEVIPMTPEEAKPKWNNKNGRYEEPTKEIAL
jgi:hypothetical protein